MGARAGLADAASGGWEFRPRAPLATRTSISRSPSVRVSARSPGPRGLLATYSPLEPPVCHGREYGRGLAAGPAHVCGKWIWSGRSPSIRMHAQGRARTQRRITNALKHASTPRKHQKHCGRPQGRGPRPRSGGQYARPGSRQAGPGALQLAFPQTRERAGLRTRHASDVQGGGGEGGASSPGPARAGGRVLGRLGPSGTSPGRRLAGLDDAPEPLARRAASGFRYPVIGPIAGSCR